MTSKKNEISSSLMYGNSTISYMKEKEGKMPVCACTHTWKHTHTHAFKWYEPFSLPIHSVVSDLVSVKGKLECDLFSVGLSFYKPYIEAVFCHFAVEIFFTFAFLFVCVFLNMTHLLHFILNWRNRSIITMEETVALLDLLRDVVSNMVSS